MIDNLKLVIRNAYTPFSKFNVACIIKMSDKQEFIGVNVENASFKNGLCAEQVAISSAVADGYSKDDFMELHVMGSADKITMPCFMCRQLLVEFFYPDAKIFCYNKDGKIKEFSLSELCPHPFDIKEA